MELRDYQLANNSAIRERESFGPVRDCVCSPTGSGKSVMMADLLCDDKPQCLFTHRRFLLKQLSAVLESHGVEFGIRADGFRPNLAARIQLAMTQTEWSRVFERAKAGKRSWPLHNAGRILIDEPHAQSGAVMQKIADTYYGRNASVIGFDATPREVGHIFTHQLVPATVTQLIGRGYLVPPIVFGPDMPDADALEAAGRQSNGEYSKTGLEKVWNVHRIFGRVAENYCRLNPTGKAALLFASGVPHSLWFAQQLSNAGIPAAHIDSDTVWIDGEFLPSNDETRERVFEASRTGKIKVLCNYFVLREGFDAPWIEHVILACVIGARSNFVQMVGRGARPWPGKEHFILQDHGGNWLRHPPWDCDDPWDMSTPERVLAQIRISLMRLEAGRPDAPRTTPEPICCPRCFSIRLRGDECPVCKYRYAKRSRPVVQLDGELKMQEGFAYKPYKIKKSEPTDAGAWKRLFWGCRKHRPNRTFQQLWNYDALQHGWKWLPRDLPLMPVEERHWFMPVGDVPLDCLRN